jgi:hypothetical protein
MSTSKVILCLLLIVSANYCFTGHSEGSEGWMRKGYFFTRLYQDTENDNIFEKQEDIESRLRLENQFKHEDIFLQLNLEARSEFLVHEKTSHDADFFLKEAYAEIRKPRYCLALGRQTVTWGKLDDVVILDRISPQEYKRFILYDKQERKLPLFMFKGDFFLDSYEIEGVYLPRFKASDVRFFGSDWSVYDHLLENITESGTYPEGVKNIIRSIRLEEEEKLSAKTFANGQFGIRFKSKLRELDYDLYYMNIYQSIATLKEKTAKGNILKKFLNVPCIENLNALIASNPSGDDLTLEEAHPRTHIIGLDSETVYKNFGLRLETGLFLRQAYLKDDFSYIRKDTLVCGLGADHTTSDNLYLNLQFIETYILDYCSLFAEKEHGHQVTATLTKDYLRGNLVFNFKNTYNMSYHDWMVNPKLTYKFKNGFKATLAGFIFEGDSATLFGRFSDKDLIYLEGRYEF